MKGDWRNWEGDVRVGEGDRSMGLEKGQVRKGQSVEIMSFQLSEIGVDNQTNILGGE